MTEGVFGRLRRLWARWEVIAHAIGNFQARFLLSLLYFVLVPPFGLLVRLFMDPLQLRWRARESFWLAAPSREQSLTAARRQF
jgi:hypothetical protein